MKTRAVFKNLLYSAFKTVLVIATATVFFACELGGASEQVHANQAKPLEEKSAVQPSYLKPGAGVYLASPSSIEMQRAQNKTVQVNLRSIHKQGKLTLRINGEEALSTRVKSPQALEFVLDQQSDVLLTLEVKAQRDGKYYIHIFAVVDSPLGVQHRAMALPVYVGDDETIAQLKNRKPTKPRAIKSMPAEETITDL